MTEVKKAIKKFKKAKSPGYDYICAEHLQWGGENLVFILCTLFNLCVLREYVFGEAFKYLSIRERMPAVWMPIIIGVLPFYLVLINFLKYYCDPDWSNGGMIIRLFMNVREPVKRNSPAFTQLWYYKRPWLRREKQQ